MLRFSFSASRNILWEAPDESYRDSLLVGASWDLCDHVQRFEAHCLRLGLLLRAAVMLERQGSTDSEPLRRLFPVHERVDPIPEIWQCVKTSGQAGK